MAFTPSYALGGPITDVVFLAAVSSFLVCLIIMIRARLHATMQQQLAAITSPREDRELIPEPNASCDDPSHHDEGIVSRDSRGSGASEGNPMNRLFGPTRLEGAHWRSIPSRDIRDPR